MPCPECIDTVSIINTAHCGIFLISIHLFGSLSLFDPAKLAVSLYTMRNFQLGVFVYAQDPFPPF